MCWKSYDKPVMKTAKKDMTVYKILRVEIVKNDSSTICSPFFPTCWELGEEYELDKLITPEKTQITKWLTSWYIDEGFHTFSEKPRLKKIKNKDVIGDGWWNVDNVNVIFNDKFINKNIELAVFKCTIPKGSIYYENEHHNVVSDRLIINERIEHEIIN